MIYRILLSSILCSLLSVGNAQFVDTLKFTVEKEFSVFRMANYNCRETHADLGCKSDKNTTCFVCFHPQNEQDSILQYKTRIHDSLYMKIFDKKGILRLEYLQPHAQAISGRVKVYDKKGDLIRLEYYSTGKFEEEESPNHHEVKGHKPFRVGLWKYFNKGHMYKSERYQLLHTPDQNTYFVLITELTYWKGSKAVKDHREYVLHLDDLEFQHKPPKFQHSIFEVKGFKP